jgi:hypothetical protein
MIRRIFRCAPKAVVVALLFIAAVDVYAQKPAAAGRATTLASKPATAEPTVKPATASNVPQITFRRVFKSSTPELIEIMIPENSDAATYEIRQLDDDPGSNTFSITDGLRGKIFSLAAQLNHFQSQDLDVHRKIANLGEKTFRWQQGTTVYETKFNYTLNAPATQLMQIFEGLARQQEHLELLTRRMKYDRLGINDALMDCDADFTRGLLPQPQELLPILDQIAADPHIVDIARQRARVLAERIRHPK